MAIVSESNNVEKVVTGKGIAFQKRKGDEIDVTKIEKQFDLVKKGIGEKTRKIIDNVPTIYFRVCDEIINQVTRILGLELDEIILISLADHISYAVERKNNNQMMVSTVDWEIKHFYPKEYSASQIALDIIEKRLNVRLDDYELVYIALHIVNAQNGKSTNVRKQMDLLHDILRLVQLYFKVELDPNSLMYARLINHLKYLSHKINNKIYEDSYSIVSLEELSQKYPNEVSCVKKINTLIEKKYQYSLSESDMVYLVMHIFRIIL